MFHRKCQKKVGLGICFVENAEIMHGCEFIENDEIGTVGDLFDWEDQIRYGWGLVHRTCQNIVSLGIYFIENSEIRNNLGFIT